MSYNKEGIGRYVASLLENFSLEVASKTLLVTLNEQVLPESILKKGFREKNIVVPGGRFVGLRTARAVVKVAREEDNALLLNTHSHLVAWLYTNTAWLVHDISPVVHPEFFGLQDNKAKGFAFNFLFGAAMHKARYILTTTKFVKDEIIAKYNVNSEKVWVIGAGMSDDIEINANEKKTLSKFTLEKYRLSENNYFLAIGTLSPRKNYSLLLKAYADYLVADESAAAKLVIVGKKGWLYDEIFETYNSLKSQLQDKVVFTEYVSDAELIVLLESCKAYVNPSLYEGLGLPLLAAVKAKKPMIVSNIPPFKELTSGLAEFFNPQSEAELVARLKTAPEKGKAPYTAAQAEAVLLQYSWPAVVSRLIDLLKLT